MSESLKPRFSVDLNEFERQIAQAPGASPAQPAPATRNDPLAELARIVGQDDPFRSLLNADGTARPRQQGAPINDLFAVRDNVTQMPRQAQAHEGHEAYRDDRFDASHYPQEPLRSAPQSHAYQPAVHHHQPHAEAYDNGAYQQGYYDENAGHYADQDYGQSDHSAYAPLERKRSRKGMLAVGAVLGAAVIGLGGAYMFVGKSVLTVSGAPPLIKASNEPTKVPPQNPGGVEIPNQNKQIYERASQSTETKVVNREEQPVDVKQAVRMNAGTSADATGATASSQAQPPSNGLNLGEPRKVRTVSIRPDGTMVTANAGSKPSASAPIPTMTLPAAAQPAPAAPATPAAESQPKPMASTPAASAPRPVPAAATPASTPAPQKVASAQPVAIPAPAPAAADTTATGGFVIQLGLASSEAAANTSFTQLQKKYSDLDGMPSLIRKAEVNGSTIYRIRVGPLSKDEASSLCSKLQGQGGQCFVAKN